MLLSTISDKCRIEKLALIKFSWTEKSWKLFCNYFREDVMLDDIDISYSVGLCPDHYIPFLVDLSYNKRIRNCNLAWCNIIENQDVALARESSFAALFKKLKAKRIAESKKKKPSSKPITMLSVQKDQEKYKESISPKKKAVRQGDSTEHPLRPLFEEMPKDFDLVQRQELPMVEGEPSPRHYMLKRKRPVTPQAKSPRAARKGSVSPLKKTIDTKSQESAEEEKPIMEEMSE
jgi:hypothetical protein